MIHLQEFALIFDRKIAALQRLIKLFEEILIEGQYGRAKATHECQNFMSPKKKGPST